MSETQVAITRYEWAGDPWPGEPDETFCALCQEDCYGWLGDVAPAIISEARDAKFPEPGPQWWRS